MEQLIKKMVGVLVVLLASAAVQAEFGLVENFDSMATGSPDGIACSGLMGGTWDTEGEGTGNVNIEDRDGSRVLQFRGHSSGVTRGVGFNGITNTIDDSEAGKVFLRFMLRASSETSRTYIGLISDTTTDPITDTGTNTNTDIPMTIPVGFGLVDNGSGGFDLVKTDGTTVLKAGLERAQWYNVWIVADNEADTFDLYLSEATGPAGVVTLPNPADLVASGIPFGVPTTEPLNGMIFACPGGTGQSTRTYIDEIYWDGDQGLWPPKKAKNPSPTNKEPDVPRDVVLSWTAGAHADKHDVYFGTVLDDVNQATTTADPNGVYQDRIDPNTYTFAERLGFDTTYYWRVDEVNGPPDFTVFEGSVWQFTTEPVAYPIENITAIASSAHQADMGPENTINGLGLDDNDLHSTQETAMWLSSSEPNGAWIEYEFDKVYKLHQMWVWNSNRSIESLLGMGFRDVAIEYSTNGTDYTTLGTTVEFARATSAAGYAHNTTVDFGGVAAQYVRLTATSNWGGILPQYGLSEVRFFYIPVNATKPYPDSGATGVPLDVVLGWVAGREAVTHDVYLSTDEQAMIDGTAPVTTVTETSYGPLSLDLGQTYYWRVDEVNMAETPTTWESDVWNFTTHQFLVVDDFESYNDLHPTDPESNRIFLAWIDGYEVPTNGSLVGYDAPPFAEQSIIHGGKQAMPFFYNNTGGAAYSEAERTFAVPQNWTEAGVGILVLYFYGTEGNTGQLYVKVDGSKVVYDGDVADIAKPLWNQWSIDLASLGVNLQNITTLSIGIDGNGASGTLYVDDIRLALSFPATGVGGGSILFVSSLEEEHMPGDDAIKAFFERLGHGVTYIDDDEDEAYTEAAAAAADLVYISESVGSGDIKNEITEIETPIIVAEPYAWDEMGLTTANPEAINQVTDSVNITIINAGHPLAAGYSGDVPVFTALSENELIPVGTTGGGAIVIARGSGNTQTDADVYFVYEKGAALASPPADGSPQVAADTRIGFFAASPTAEELLSNEGYDLLSAAVNYALGMTE